MGPGSEMGTCVAASPSWYIGFTKLTTFAALDPAPVLRYTTLVLFVPFVASPRRTDSPLETCGRAVALCLQVKSNFKSSAKYDVKHQLPIWRSWAEAYFL
ncbi:hypothetical protein CC2G_014023 [Coprinopsis cinerea AmutBmut pab1-1]|nr:hypothetical protein CC2G_014023 [Coprinopsis cinerea AmutBmut pab1-1]